MRHWDGRVERVAGTVDGDTIDTLASEFVPRQLKAAVRGYTDALYKASHEQVSIAWYTPARLRPCVGRVGTMLYALHVFPESWYSALAGQLTPSLLHGVLTATVGCMAGFRCS